MTLGGVWFTATVYHAIIVAATRSIVTVWLLTNVTPGFKDKTECIAICMPGSSFIHIETS